jgi:hypothetical protein
MNRSVPEKKRLIVLMLILIVFSIPTSPAMAASVTLAWDSPSVAPEGYRVFARKDDAAYDYTDPKWYGTGVTCTIDDLDEQTEYYFVVRAYDGNTESADSNEVHYIPPESGDSEADVTPPTWNGATAGIGRVNTDGSDASVIVEFDTAIDLVDGSDLLFNVYYAPTASWDDSDWTANSVVANAAVGEGDTFTNAVSVGNLTGKSPYTFGVRVEDRSGNEDGNTMTMTAIPVEAKSDVPFQQDAGADGWVLIEAEDFNANILQGGHDWVMVYPAGYSGSASMQAQPDIGTNSNSDYVSASPRLDYTVNFVHTGVHYVWVRGIGADTGADSVHVGLDGKASATGDRMNSFFPTWSWSNQTKDQAVAWVNVPTTGIHTVNVWMREDGFVIDKLALTINPVETWPVFLKP